MKKKRYSSVSLKEFKKNGEKISVLTAYDAPFSRLIDKAGVEAILVGDSLGMVVQGKHTTIPVTLEQAIYHTKMVVDNTKSALIIADMPFGSYQISKEKAIENCCRVIKETGAGAVKMEGGEYLFETIEYLVNIGIPVFGHLGLTPQSINKFGSYGLRGVEEEEVAAIKRDAKLLEKAGVSGIFLEKIPAKLAEEITKELDIPTIGIGSGNSCDGQVLVSYDMLGLDERVNFKFVRKYANLSEVINDAVKGYIDDVKSTNFPSEDESY